MLQTRLVRKALKWCINITLSISCCLRFIDWVHPAYMCMLYRCMLCVLHV